MPQFRRTIFVILISLIVGWTFVSNMSYAVAAQPDPCRDVVSLRQYLVKNIPAKYWQDEHCINGGIYEQNKEYQRALIEYHSALNASPNSQYTDLLQMTIGETYMEMKDYARALATYEKVFKNYPNSVWRDALQYNIAVAHYKAGNSAEAKKALQVLIDEYPASVFVGCAQQNVQSIERGQPPIFLTDTLNDDADKMADEVKLYVQVAEAFEQATEACRQNLLSFVPGNNIELFMQVMDMIENATQEVPSGINEKDILDILEQTMNQTKSFSVAEFFANTVDEVYAPAFILADEYLKKYPNSDRAASVYHTVITIYYTCGDFDKAAKVYQRMEAAIPADNPYRAWLKPLIEKLHPVIVLRKNADALFDSAKTYFEKGAYTKAIASSERFLKKFPKDDRVPQVQMLVGNAYFAKNMRPVRV